MTDIINRMSNSIVGPSINDWLMLSAKFAFRSHLIGVRKDGNILFEDRTIELPRIDLLELSDNKSHIHFMDGDDYMDVQGIVYNIFKIPAVQEIYQFKENNRNHIIVVLSEDLVDISLKLAAIKVEYLKSHPEHDFEIRYTLTDNFASDSIPQNSKRFIRE